MSQLPPAFLVIVSSSPSLFRHCLKMPQPFWHCLKLPQPIPIPIHVYLYTYIPIGSLYSLRVMLMDMAVRYGRTDASKENYTRIGVNKIQVNHGLHMIYYRKYITSKLIKSKWNYIIFTIMCSYVVIFWTKTSPKSAAAALKSNSHFLPVWTCSFHSFVYENYDPKNKVKWVYITTFK